MEGLQQDDGRSPVGSLSMCGLAERCRCYEFHGARKTADEGM